MKTPLACAVLLSLALVATPLAAADSDADQLTRLEEVWNQAHLKGDGEALEKIWADDFALAVPEMPLMSRADAVAVWRSASHPRFSVYETSDLRIRVYGDAAVVTGRMHRKREFKDRAAEDFWLFTKVYVRQAAAWKVVAFHASPAPKS